MPFIGSTDMAIPYFVAKSNPASGVEAGFNLYAGSYVVLFLFLLDARFDLGRDFGAQVAPAGPDFTDDENDEGYDRAEAEQNQQHKNAWSSRNIAYLIGEKCDFPRI